VDRSRYEYARPSDAEFARRHRVVREFMDRRDLEYLLVQGSTAIWDRGWTNTRWLTNHAGCQLSQAEYVVFPRDPDEAITVSTIDMFAEMPARRARAIVDDVRPSGFRCIRGAIDRLQELDADGDAIGLVEVNHTLSLPYEDRIALEAAFPAADIRPVTEPFWRLRHVKSDEELAFVRRSAEIGDRVMERVVASIEPGMRESELWGTVAHEMTRHGGELPTMILCCSTSTHDSDDGHQRERPRDRRLAAGDLIINEHAPRYPDGSESQIGIPVCLGEPSPQYREMLDLMLEVYEAVVAALRAGNTGADVIAAGAPIEEAGYVRSAPLVHGELGGGISGPTVGVEDHGEGHTGADVRFEENMTVVPEIHVATPDWSAGVFMNSTFVVTDGAPEPLTTYPREPVVL
jgi:Xaa-Pro aminopeptidase